MYGQISNVLIENLGPDGLTGDTWAFYLLNDRLVLDEYRSWSKQSKRHKATVHASWSRLGRRSLDNVEPPLTEDICRRAKAAWLQKVEAVVTVGVQGKH